jgi:hypothetical protein
MPWTRWPARYVHYAPATWRACFAGLRRGGAELVAHLLGVGMIQVVHDDQRLPPDVAKGRRARRLSRIRRPPRHLFQLEVARVNEQGSPSPSDEQDDFEVTGAEAEARWRQVRGPFYVASAILVAVFLVSWLLWHRTWVQLGWICLGVGAFVMAAFIWRHNLVAFSYVVSSGAGERKTSFVGKPPPVPRELAAPVLVLAGIVLFVAGTGTGIGRWLSSTLEAGKTVYDAGSGLAGLVLTPIAAIVVLVIVGFGFGLLGSGTITFSKVVVAVVRRRDAGGSTGLTELAMGTTILGVLTLMVFLIVLNWDTVVDEAFGPYRTIWGWFT